MYNLDWRIGRELGRRQWQGQEKVINKGGEVGVVGEEGSPAYSGEKMGPLRYSRPDSDFFFFRRVFGVVLNSRRARHHQQDVLYFVFCIMLGFVMAPRGTAGG